MNPLAGPRAIFPVVSVEVDFVFFRGESCSLLHPTAGEISLPVDKKAVRPHLPGFYGPPGAAMLAPGLIIFPLYPYVGHGLLLFSWGDGVIEREIRGGHLNKSVVKVTARQTSS